MTDTKLELFRLKSLIRNMEVFQNNQSNKLVKAQIVGSFTQVLDEINGSLKEKAIKLLGEHME